MAHKNNILSIGTSTEVLDEILLTLDKSLSIQKDILVELKLNNEYLKALTDREFNSDDLC